MLLFDSLIDSYLRNYYQCAYIMYNVKYYIQCKIWIMKLADYHDQDQKYKGWYQRESVNETLNEG